MENMIDVTDIDLRALVKNAYAYSRPQGLGFLHSQSGPLDEATVDEILACGCEQYPVDMDYIKGRAVKLTVFNKGGKLWITDRWYDHTEHQLKDMLQACRSGVDA
jgi:hypothetical protein